MPGVLLGWRGQRSRCLSVCGDHLATRPDRWRRGYRDRGGKATAAEAGRSGIIAMAGCPLGHLAGEAGIGGTIVWATWTLGYSSGDTGSTFTVPAGSTLRPVSGKTSNGVTSLEAAGAPQLTWERLL